MLLTLNSVYRRLKLYFNQPWSIAHTQLGFF